MRSGASISGDYRYHLWRAWKVGSRSVCFIGLNPSTADAEQDDPTIRREIAYAQAWGFGSLDKLNAYAYRTPYPAVLQTAGYPVGEHTDATMRRVLAEYVDLVVCAWGTKAEQDRADAVLELVREAGFQPHALRVTKNGHPEHPLYLRADLLPRPYGPVLEGARPTTPITHAQRRLF